MYEDISDEKLRLSFQEYKDFERILVFWLIKNDPNKDDPIDEKTINNIYNHVTNVNNSIKDIVKTLHRMISINYSRTMDTSILDKIPMVAAVGFSGYANDPILKRLSPFTRILIYLKDVKKMKQKEIAEIMQATESQVSRYYRKIEEEIKML